MVPANLALVRLVTRIIQHIAYGYRGMHFIIVGCSGLILRCYSVEDMDDYWVQTQRHFVTCTMKLPGLGTHLVDIFPFREFVCCFVDSTWLRHAMQCGIFPRFSLAAT
jgi:hypothetical protein